MPPTVEDRMHDIREAIARIETISGVKSFDDFESDLLVRLATERCLEIVCEASRHLPEHIKATAPAIDWRSMIDFGNRLRHAYNTTDVAVVWRILKVYLPPLKAFVESRLTASDE